jgi:hypothetical protein
LYPRYYDPQTHRFANILPHDRTYHVERDTVRIHAADNIIRSDVAIARRALELQLPDGMTSKLIGSSGLLLHLPRAVMICQNSQIACNSI